MNQWVISQRHFCRAYLTRMVITVFHSVLTNCRLSYPKNGYVLKIILLLSILGCHRENREKSHNKPQADIALFKKILEVNSESVSRVDTHWFHLMVGGKKYKLFTISDRFSTKPIIYLKDDLYSMEYYTGGNHVNAECFQLMKINDSGVLLVGKYKGYKDIDNDGEKDFYILKLKSFGESSADNENIETKMGIVSNKFKYPSGGFYQ